MVHRQRTNCHGVLIQGNHEGANIHTGHKRQKIDALTLRKILWMVRPMMLFSRDGDELLHINVEYREKQITIDSNRFAVIHRK
jgi:hypothetical protein